MNLSRRAQLALLVFGVISVGVVPTVTGATKTPAAAKAPFTAALVSDIGRFNDKSFNQLQYSGLKKAQTQLGVKILPLQSNSRSPRVGEMKIDSSTLR